MKKLIFEFSPVMALLLILSLVIPVGFTATSTTPAMAAVDNCYITSPTTLAKVYTRVNGTIPIDFTINLTGDLGETYVANFMLMKNGSVVYNLPVLPITAPGSPYTATYNASVPLGVANDTYDLQMSAYQSTGGGSATPVPSPIISSCVVINSTHVPATPGGLLPASGICSSVTNPTFSWTAVTETNYTFRYNFQLATNSSFSPTVVSVNQAGVSYASSGLASGTTYYWRVQAQDQYGNTGAWTATRTLCIDTAAPTAPGNTGRLPADTSPIAGSYNPTYVWEASTDAATCTTVRYFVETYNASSVLVDNVTGIANPQVGNPSVVPSSTLGAGTYTWKVCAYDCAGNLSSYSTTWSYTIPATCTSYNVTMGTGWNLFSLPLCPSSATSITPAALLALCDNSTAVQIIWGYDCSSGWQYYIPGSPSTLTSISVVKGYWVQTSSPVTFAVTGTSCPAPPQSLITATLCPGWNLVGYKSCTSMASNVYFPTGIASAISFICGYSGGWNCFAPGATNLEPTKGYWVFYGGTTNGTYGLPCN